MLWPTEPRIVYQASIVSAARVIRMIMTGELGTPNLKRTEYISKIHEQAMPIEHVATVLMNLPLENRFCVAVEEIFGTTDVYQVVEFFLTCPSELRPSLNKAIHFMKHGGFRLRCSPATLKTNWVKYVVSSPFAFVDFPTFDFQPDDLRHVAESIELLDDEEKLIRWFGQAKYVQEQLLDRFDQTTRSRFRFVEFPAGIDYRPIKLGTYTPEQIKIIKSYRAPSSYSESSF
jgi:hypothetical protein